MSASIEPCLIHKAVFAWINYDPNRWFKRHPGHHREVMKKRRATQANIELQQRIYDLRNPRVGPPMSQRRVAELLGVSQTTVKTYQKKYLDRTSK